MIYPPQHLQHFSGSGTGRSSLNVCSLLSMKSRKVKASSQVFAESILRSVSCYFCTHLGAMATCEAGAWSVELSYWCIISTWTALNVWHSIPLG